MTTVNVVNPFWGRAFTYWRWTPIGNSIGRGGAAEVSEFVMASSPGGANLLSSATVTVPNASFSLAFLTDGSTSSGVVNIGQSLGIPSNEAYLQAQFVSPVSVREIRISSGTTNLQNAPEIWALAASNDGTSWTGFGIYTSAGYTAQETKAFVIGPPSENGGRTSRVWAWYNASTVNARVQIREFEYAGSGGGANIATGGTPTGRLTLGTADAPAEAFDGNLSNSWASVLDGRTAVLAYLFATAQSPTHYRLRVASGNLPTDWGVYYLSNCADWVLADSVAGEGSWSVDEEREYEMDA